MYNLKYLYWGRRSIGVTNRVNVGQNSDHCISLCTDNALRL